MAQTLMLGISEHILKTALDIDAPVLSTNIKRFKQLNKDAYAILISTWAGVVRDKGGQDACQVLYNYITTRGLVKTIQGASELANRIIASMETYDSITQVCVDEELHNLAFIIGDATDPEDVLFILRFPKRFSPSCCDKLEDRALSAFLTINENCKGEPRTISFSKGWKRKASLVTDTNPYGWYLATGPVLEYDISYPEWLIKDVRTVCHQILDEFTWLDDEALTAEGSFSNGATADGCHTMAEKLWCFSKYQPYYKHPLYPISSNFAIDDTPVKVVAVPKNYKQPRLIAEASAYKQFHLQAIRWNAEIDIKYSPYAGQLNLKRQDLNQDLAFEGSVHGTYATVDLSSASDSISTHLARKILPKNYFEAIERWNSKTMLVQGKEVERFIFQTSGNGSTFVIESVIFLAIAKVATDYYRFWNQGKRLAIRKPRTYGDDIICDVRVYETLVDFLTMLGFSVNTEKSFAHGTSYRESCGAEYFNGIDVSTKYFPRQRIAPYTAEGLSSLIDLEKRLFRCPTARNYLLDLIREIFAECGPKFGWQGRITCSEPGSTSPDLWLFAEDSVRGYAPCKGKIDPITQPYALRKKHSVLQTRIDKEYKQRLLKRDGVDDPTTLIPMLEMMRYVDFLQYGPQYDSPLDELLNVSSPRASVDSLLYVEKGVWVLKS